MQRSAHGVVDAPRHRRGKHVTSHAGSITIICREHYGPADLIRKLDRSDKLLFSMRKQFIKKVCRQETRSLRTVQRCKIMKRHLRWTRTWYASPCGEHRVGSLRCSNVARLLGHRTKILTVVEEVARKRERGGGLAHSQLDETKLGGRVWFASAWAKTFGQPIIPCICSLSK